MRVRTDLLVVQSDMILDYSSDILESYHGLAICSILTKDYLSFEFYLRAAAYLYGHVKIESWCSLLLYYLQHDRLEDAYILSRDSMNLITDSRVIYIMSIHMNVCYRLGRYDECMAVCAEIEAIEQSNPTVYIDYSIQKTIEQLRNMCSYNLLEE